MFYTYLLRCEDHSLYAGITTDPARRFAQHCGKLSGGAKYTAVHRPVRMEAAWRSADRAAASRLEYKLKHLSKAKKESLLLADSAVPLPEEYTRVPIESDGTVPLPSDKQDKYYRFLQDNLPCSLYTKRQAKTKASVRNKP